ncbi:hypothetical protein D3C73_875690 [compost metagenome]
MYVWMLNMIHSDRPTSRTITIAAKTNAITLLRCAAERSRCRKYTRCTSTWTIANARTINRVIDFGSVGYITRPNGMTVRITDRMKPMAYDL